MSATYRVYNGPRPTTASQVAVTTGTAIKSLLQLSTKSGIFLPITAWGISFDGSAAATPGIVELCEVDVAATVTAYAAADILAQTDPAGAAADTALITLSTTTSGYTASAEGTITALRQFDAEHIAPTNQYIYQWPLGREPVLQASKFLRIRVKFAVAVNAICWVEFEG